MTTINPFEGAAAYRRSSWIDRVRESPARIALLVFLAVGLGMAVWRTLQWAERNQTTARAEALAIAAGLEAEITQAVAGADLLATLVKAEGAAFNFQKAAADIAAGRPGVSSFELQPGGIVKDVYPRAGNERLLGFNSLTHPAYAESAKAALQKRSVAVAGPLRLSRGGIGLVVIAPVYTRRRDQGEVFWGFVTASVSLPALIARSRLEELASNNFDYGLYTPASPRQGTIFLAKSGAFSLDNAVQQPIQAHDLEMRIGLLARNGWINKGELILECLMVLVLVGALWSLIIAIESRRDLKAALAKANRQLAELAAARAHSEQEQRKTEESVATLQAELRQARCSLQQLEPMPSKLAAAERRTAELQSEFDRVIRAAGEQSRDQPAYEPHATLALADAHEKIRGLEDQLAEALRREKDATLSIRKRQDQDRAAIAELQGRLDNAINSARESAQVQLEERAQTEAALKQARQTIAALEIQLIEANQSARESAAAAQSRHDRDRTALAELERQLHTARQSAAQYPAGSAELAPPPRAGEPAPSAEQAQLAAPPWVRENAPVADPAAVTASEVSPKPARPSKRRREEVSDQIPLWAGSPAAASDSEQSENETVEPAEGDPMPASREHKSAHGFPPSSQPELRKAFHQILPLLADQDPGAADCLKDNRGLFRSAFAPADYAEFEEWTKVGKFNAALDQLRKAAKKHGITL